MYSIANDDNLYRQASAKCYKEITTKTERQKNEKSSLIGAFLKQQTHTFSAAKFNKINSRNQSTSFMWKFKLFWRNYNSHATMINTTIKHKNHCRLQLKNLLIFQMIPSSYEHTKKRLQWKKGLLCVSTTCTLKCIIKRTREPFLGAINICSKRKVNNFEKNSAQTTKLWRYFFCCYLLTQTQNISFL